MFRLLILASLAAASFAASGDDGTSSPAQTGSEGGGATSHSSGPSLSAFVKRVQVHGTFGQSFVYGSGNNYLSMKTNDGSFRFSDGTINLTTAFTDNFHAGVQLHSYVLGQLGRGNVMIDWAFGDYKVRDWLGFRGGIIKVPMGFFNDISDMDTLYNWALLPQSIYESEYRSFNIPLTGGVIYGGVQLPKAGRVSYQFFGGQRRNALNDGSELMSYQTYGIVLGSALTGYGYGGDVKWQTPITGLTAGISYDNDRLVTDRATWYNNPYGLPPIVTIDSGEDREIFSVGYQRGKLDLVAEGRHQDHFVLNRPVSVTPRNGWYVMGSYHASKKLTVGSYFSRLVGTSYNVTTTWAAYDPSKPLYYGNDTVVNLRYDVNRFIYLKLEGHYIDGELGPFFPGTNPDGIQKVTRLAIVRAGFTF